MVIVQGEFLPFSQTIQDNEAFFCFHHCLLLVPEPPKSNLTSRVWVEI